MKRSLGVLDRDAVVARARSVIGAPIEYRLGAGGRDPRAKTPGTRPKGEKESCDCSGFVAWAVGVDRYLPNAGIPTLPTGAWLETSAIYRDARSPFGVAVEVEWDMALPGDLLVYPDYGGRQGHIGVVSEVSERGDGPLRVVHCSVGNFRATGSAIRETSVDVFRLNGSIVARLAWVQ